MRSITGIATALVVMVQMAASAQQLPQYAQFMSNRLLYNPAAAGVSGGLQATALGRWQWVGFKGAPNTQAFALDAAIPDKKVGLGLVVNRDEAAIISVTNITLNYAYHLNLGEGKLSMGIAGSVLRSRVDFTKVYVPDTDPNFALLSSNSRVNFGAGLLYEQSNFWVSVSVPELVNNRFEEQGDTFYKSERHYFIAGGYRYAVSPRVRLEPSVMLKAVEGSSLGFDVNVMTWIDDRWALGLGYRPSESLNLILQMKITERLKLGYAFDYIVDNTLNSVGSTSHEVMLSYRMPWAGKVTAKKTP